MKHKYFTDAFIALIGVFFLMACAPKPSSQVVLTESVSAGRMSQECTDASVSESQTEKEEAAESFYVYVCGAVAKPGVYSLPAGSRLYEAVDAAGGFLPEACEDYCNLAMTVSDGVQYRIPTTQEVESGSLLIQGAEGTGSFAGQQGVSSYNAEGLLNINLASAEELMTLPGIGETRADAIITYREEHGAFACKEDIMQVTGIKEASYQKIEDYITVE